MKKTWVLLLALVTLTALLAVPGVAAAELSPESVETQVVPANSAIDTCLYARPAGMSDTDWAAFETLVRGEAPRLTCADPEAMQLTFEENGIYIRSTANDVIWHCVCGANINESHIGDCRGYDVSWEPLEVTGNLSLPSSAKRYYLVDADSNPNDNSVAYTRQDITNVNGLYVDLNGVTVTQTTSVRFANFYCNSATVPTVVVFTDSSQGHTGKLVPKASGLNEGSIDHSNIWLRGSAANCLSTTMTFYRVNVDCSQKTNTNSSGFSVSAGNFLNLYGCHVIGGTAVNSYGGALTNSGTTTVVGGSITGGSATTNGATVYNAGTLVLDGVEISGGTARYGGAVYVAGGSVTARNGTVIDGGTAAEGGAVYIAAGASFTLDDSEVKNGISTRDAMGDALNTASDANLNDGKGSNFYVLGTLNVQNGSVIRDGTVNVLNSSTTYDGDDGNDYGGSAIYLGAGANAAVTDSEIHGYTGAKLWKRAGTIFNVKGTLTLTNTTVTGTAVNIDSGVIWNNGGTVHMTGGSLDASNLNKCQGLTKITYGGAVRNSGGGIFNLNSGTIQGFKTDATNGGTAVYTSGTFNQKGGTIRGATTTSGGIGGAVAVAGGTFTMTGGTIQGGQAQKGGSVYVASGTFDMKKGTIQGGQAVYGGNVYVNGGTFRMNGAESVITLGEARYNAAGNSSTYAYGGNVYMAGGTFTMTGGSTVTYGACFAKSATGWSPGGNVYVDAGTLNVTGSTISHGQDTIAGLSQGGVDGNNLYINYNATVNLNSGAVIHNTVSNSQENILIQGGTLNIAEGCSITNKEGAVCRNLVANSSALTDTKKDENDKDYYHFNNVGKAPRINMSGGIITGGRSAAGGGNVLLSHLSVFNMTGGTIENGVAVNGGNLCVESQPSSAIVKAYNEMFPDAIKTAEELAGQVHISGSARIIGGTISGTEKNGGSIFMGDGTTLTVLGNAQIYGGQSAWCAGNIYSNGFVTIGENAGVYDGRARYGSYQPNIYVVDGQLTLEGNAQIAGGVGAYGSTATVTLKGSPVVDKALTGTGKQLPTEGLKLLKGATLVFDGLTENAQIGLLCGDFKNDSEAFYTLDEATKGYIISGVIGSSELAAITYESREAFLVKTAGDKLAVVPKADAVGAVFSGSSWLYDLPTAISLVSDSTQWVQLLSDYTGSLTVAKDLRLDMNGHSITGDVDNSGHTLYLLDSANAGYTYENGKLNGAVSGTVARDFTTGKLDGYGHNYRFLVLKDKDGSYSAHRIYLTVRSTVLYPMKPALNFRTVLKCDSVVAAYINNGGAYGVKITAVNGDTTYETAYGDYTQEGITIVAAAAGDNNYITQLNNILAPGWDMAKQKLYTESVLNANAYIRLSDFFYSADAEEEITSGKVAKSFKDAVVEADRADPETLTLVQRAALGDMYSSFSQLMSTWDLQNISSEEYRKHKVRYYCQCGDPDSQENPCANSGHKPQAWSQWTDATSLPTVTGNYYLGCDVNLKGQVSLKANQFICIDTNGFDITSEGRIAYVKGDNGTTVLNFSNSKWESDVSVLSAKGVAYTGTSAGGGDGGILLMHGGSNVSLYKGIKLQLAEGHSVDRGGLIMNEGGDINLYGAELVGAELVSSENDNAGNGGALYMTSGNLYMNSGSITGGNAVNGGAVYACGHLTVEGTARISGGICRQLGGNVCLYGREESDSHTLLVLGEDAVIENGAAGENGNNIYLNSYSDAQIFGTVRNTLSGGTYTTENGGSYTVGLNSVYVGTVHSQLILEETGAIVNEKAEGAQDMPCGRNVFVSGGLFTMNGGTVSGGYTLTAGESGANVYVNGGTNKATFVMHDGQIRDGVYGATSDTLAAYQVTHGGGNVFVKGIFQMHGGTVSGGKCLAANAKNSSQENVVASGHGGNILADGGEITLDGTARIENGKVAYSGGNVYLGNRGKLTMDSADASVAGGMSTWYNGGNIFVSGGCTFTLKAGTVSGGITRDGGGNVYANGTVDMRGGRMFGGMSTGRWRDHTDYASEITSFNASATNACVFLVNGNFLMSGGQIDTGVGSTRTSNDARTIKLSGDARIGGTGINLGASSKDGVYFNLDVVDGTELGENAEVFIRSGSLSHFGDYLRLNVAPEDTAYLKRLFREGDPDNCQVAYLTAEEAPDGEGGIYLVNTKAFRYKCLCGANADESHLPGCDGKQIRWNAWTTTSFPVEPGYWYLRFSTPSDGTYEGESVKYREITGATLKYDYYQDEAGNWVPVRALLKVDEFGNFIETEDGSYEQALDAKGDPIWLNSAGSAIDAAATGKVVDSYDIHVDLNGYKLEGPERGRILSYYGRSEYTLKTDSALASALGGTGVYDVKTTASDGTETVTKKYSTHRQGGAVYTITDSSQEHTAVLGSYGVFSGRERTYKGDPQGTNIWIPWQGDTLNTYRIAIDASSAKLGWGMALTTSGTANLYDTEIVGGVAQAYFSKNELTEGSNGESGYVKTVGGGITGGGAVHISTTGTVNMFGGTIRDGVALYRYMDGSNGVAYDRSVGGGNVFVDGVFNVSGTEEYPASITGGMALEYVGDNKNPLPYYTTAQGGGVYLYQGKMTVSGQVSITGNFCGTATGTEDQTNGVVGDYVSGHITNIVAGSTKASNVFLNGNTMEAQSLTGTVGYTMNGTAWEGVFAKVDTGDASYVQNGNLVPDAAQAVGVICVDDYLRYVHQTGKLQVGYGAHSIYPEEQDIINGLSLGGYGNNSYSTSKEMARITRYWSNTGEQTLSPTLARYTLRDSDDWVDMKAVAMAFRDAEGDTVIIINVDYNNISEAVGDRVKLLVSKATGVPQSNITISASHQHNGPTIAKYYWTDMDGAYTHEPDTDRTATGKGTYETMLYSGDPLQPWEPYEVRTDYATTFYTGVLNAATQAYNDLAEVVSVSGGVMDTTTGGLQFNYVRNKTLYTADDRVNVAGMLTDNHRTVSKEDESKYIKDYESEVDVTMQLVKYERADKIIVLSNFQSHPHLGDGSNNLNPTGGVVEAFRRELSALFASENKKCEVLYFSGAGGNVNSSGRISGETEKYAWEGKTLTGNSIDQKFQQVDYHGVELSKLAHAFLNDTSKLTVTVDPATANVQAKVQSFTYDVWDETKTYTMGEVTVLPTWSDVKLANAKLLVNWEAGGYLNRPGTFTEDDIFVDAVNNPNELSYWHYFCGTQTGNDRIYSYFHANGVRKRLLAKGTTGEFQITAYDLGGIGFIAAPYEMFQENGQAIKGNVKTALAASQPGKYADFPDYITNGCGYIPGEDGEYKTSPYGITIIASQANAAEGYIPSVLGYKNGGYATDTSLFAPGTGEHLVTAYVDMLNALYAAQ